MTRLNKSRQDFLQEDVLPLFYKLYQRTGPVNSRLLGELLGFARRTAYNWMNELREAGLAKLQGKFWVPAKETKTPGVFSTPGASFNLTNGLNLISPPLRPTTCKTAS